MSSDPAVADRPTDEVAPRRIGLALVLTAVVFAAVDAVWLGVVSGDLYRNEIGHLLADSVNVGAAVVFYVVYVLGLVHFVVRPGLTRATLGPSLRDAAVFGAVTYATFDLTAMAVMKDFPAKVVVIDIVWGAVLCTLTTAAVLTVLRRGVPGPTDRSPQACPNWATSTNRSILSQGGGATLTYWSILSQGGGATLTYWSILSRRLGGRGKNMLVRSM